MTSRPAPRSLTAVTGPAQERVQALLDGLVASGQSSGVQVAAYHDGRLVVDAWAGEADTAGRLVDGETLFPVYSTSKGLAATAVHRLVERRVLAYDDPIARYWPEFAANGKGGITLRHALNHSAGMAMMPEPCSMAATCDWDAMCAALAAMPATSPPGAKVDYHAITYGWLIGECASRADGRRFWQILDDEVAKPLGLTGAFIGIPDRVEPRVVAVESLPPANPPPAPAAPAAPPDPIAERAIPAWVRPLEAWINRPDVRRACIPASNGIMNARSVARHYAALLGRGVDGVRLLGDATITEATRGGPDPRRGLGYGLSGPEGDVGAVFGHGGYGGSNGMADKRTGLAFALGRRRLSDPDVVGPALAATRAALGL